MRWFSLFAVPSLEKSGSNSPAVEQQFGQWFPRPAFWFLTSGFLSQVKWRQPGFKKAKHLADKTRDSKHQHR